MKLNVSELARQLTDPFSMIEAAQVGDILMSVYLCQGTLRWHRHVDTDEVFWVHEGSMLLESEWGDVRLEADELTVVPKGIRHRSGSKRRASVLLLRCGFLPNRKNGKRRLYAADDDARLKRIDLREAARQTSPPAHFRPVARLEESTVRVAWGEGRWAVGTPARHDQLLYVLSGVAVVRTSQSMLHMHPGDFTVVPRGVGYSLSSGGDTMLVQVARE